MTDTLHDVLCRSGIAINDRQSYDQLLGDGPATAILGMVVGAVMVAIVVAPFIQPAYRRRVTRLMRFEQTGHSESETAVTDALPKPVSPAGTMDSDVIAAAAERQRRIVRGTIAALAVFMAGAAVMARLLGRNWSESGAMSVIAGLVASGPLFINVRPYRSTWTTLITVCTMTSGLVAAELLFLRDGLSAAELADELVSMVVVIIALVLASVHRTLRALVLPLTILAFVPLLALFVPIVIGTWVADCGSPPNPSDQVAVTLAVNFFYIPLFAIGFLLAFRALDLLSRLQARGTVNDFSLIAAFALVLIALLLTWGLHEQRGTQPSALILVVCGVWVATAGVAYFLAIGRAVRRAHPGHALLVLRVFDRTGRAQQFLDPLLVRWRLIGPVWQIGGPDLAPLNVSLLGSTMYLAGRLHELFLPIALTSDALERRLRRSPASDGRWGIDELFCFNSAWLGTVEQLMVISDAILIDLRGFTAERQGIREELVLLARTRRLSRTLAIGDDRTDWTHVGRLVDAAAGERAQLLTKVTVAPGAELRCLAQLADMSTRSRGTAEPCS